MNYFHSKHEPETHLRKYLLTGSCSVSVSLCGGGNKNQNKTLHQYSPDDKGHNYKTQHKRSFKNTVACEGRHIDD